MSIGGIVGFVRRSALARAGDVAAEPKSIIFAAIVLPLAGGLALFAVYFFVFNPWLLDLLKR